jgi:hypothetical protein
LSRPQDHTPAFESKAAGPPFLRGGTDPPLAEAINLI